MKTILIVLFFIGMFVYNVFKSSAAAKKKQSEQLVSVDENEQGDLFENESKLVHNQEVGKNSFTRSKATDPALEGVSSLELESRNRAGILSQDSAKAGSNESVLSGIKDQNLGKRKQDSASFGAFDRDENHGFDTKSAFDLRNAVIYSAILHRPQY